MSFGRCIGFNLQANTTYHLAGFFSYSERAPGFIRFGAIFSMYTYLHDQGGGRSDHYRG